MRRLLPWTVILAAATLELSGCGGDSVKQSKPDEPRSVTRQITETDPGLGIDESFLTEQAAKRAQLERTIRAFWSDKIGDPGAIRRMILNRKGELLMAKRSIRKSALFTETQKDSLVSPLDEESVKLSEELVAFSE